MKKLQATLALFMIVTLTGCSATKGIPTFAQSPNKASTVETVSVSSLSETAQDWFSDRDLSGDYSITSSTSISLEGSTATVKGSGASVSGSAVTIFKEGVYLLSGNLTDGQIVIDAEKKDKVQLVLHNVQISSQTSAPIYVKKADKVFISLEDGTENTLANGGSYVPIDDNNIDSVVFSKTDLTINGSGALTILAEAGHGIVSKDSLTIGSGTYQITAAEHGITGKDSIAIAAGSLNITAGEDGIHAKNSDDTTLGNLYIAGGTFVIETAGDAVSATGDIQIDGGSFRLTTGGGSKAAEMKANDKNGFRGGWFGSNSQAQDTTDSVSAKGIKADGNLTVAGESFLLDTADDAVHAGGDLLISGGNWTISAGDDGIHADKNVTIQGGTFSIPYCYEGVEGLNVTMDDGDFDIISVDDGFNAAGGMDGSGSPNQNRGNHAIVINGGTIRILSDGDSLDSNGSITLNGGKLNLTCNGNGNTAVDCDGSYTNNGAEIITNDGSEENGGSFGPGHGGMHAGFSGMPDGQQRPGGEPPIHGDRGFFQGKMPPGNDGPQPPA